jgi:hypothetical protein
MVNNAYIFEILEMKVFEMCKGVSLGCTRCFQGGKKHWDRLLSDEMELKN